MKTKLLSLSLCVVMTMIQFTVLAEEQTSEKPQNKYFNIDLAIEYAHEHDLSLKALESEIARCEYNLIVEKNNKKKFDDYNFGLTDINQFYCQSGYLVEVAEAQLRIAKRNLVAQEYNLESLVNKAFYTYLSAKTKTEIAKTNLDNSKDRQEQANLKFNQGILTALDKESFDLAVLEAQNSYNSAVRNEDFSLLSLKNTMSYPKNEELIASGSPISVEMDTTPLAEALEKSKTNVNYVSLNDNFLMAEKKFKANEAWYNSNQSEFKREKATYDAALANYTSSLNAIELEITSYYNTMLTAFENLNYLEKNLELADKQLKAAKLQFDMGMVTTVEYIDIAKSYTQLQNSLEDAKLNALLCSLNYKATYTLQNNIK